MSVEAGLLHTAARKSLYMPGMVAKRHNRVIIALAQRLEQRGLAPKAIVGASMRKLVHLIYGVVKSGQPFNAEIPMAGLEIQEGICPQRLHCTHTHTHTHTQLHYLKLELYCRNSNYGFIFGPGASDEGYGINSR
ncbi:hypothetical protein [Salinisphaera hydrothermalis]|uniref:hypothetical protein n=1 Tax=Salinisphaera hydrothermalis TaxID=563188 RepID=UPI00333F0C4D